MNPTILFHASTCPESSEIRHALRHAAVLVAAADIDGPERVDVLRRARAWIAEALAGVDHTLRLATIAGPTPIGSEDTRVGEP